jgi:4'-phosphopantetheinyl transferase EntD
MSCKFAEVGCDIEKPDHEEKRPIKHLTLLNDEMRQMQRKFEKVCFYLKVYYSLKTLAC